MWNEKEMHRFNTRYNLLPLPLTSLMTLTLDVSRSNFEIAVSQELLVWLMWNEKEASWYDTGLPVWHCPLTTPMTLTLEFQGQSLKLLYLRNGVADWHGMKRMWVIHSWPWYWPVWPWWGGRMYRIMNGVTSDVGVPSTYLVPIWRLWPTLQPKNRSKLFIYIHGIKNHIEASDLVHTLILWVPWSLGCY